MNIFLCIDDTDEKGGPGTGHMAQDICEEIEKNNWGTCTAISRHQLFVHDDIPYTSHNSALCFEATIPDDQLENIIHHCGYFLEEKSALGSDPGLCVAEVDRLSDPDKLTEFGRIAKRAVLTKNDAYELARKLNIHLSEHGGTGQGVVGALAGTGLRLTGNDGRFRGWYHLGRSGDTISVKELKSYGFIDEVKSETGETIPDETMVLFGGDEIKPVLQEAKQVILVKEAEKLSDNFKWQTLTKKQVKIY